MAYERGDVVLLPFPFTDQTATKVRPAVVVSSAEYMDSEPDLVVAGVTSRLPAEENLFDYVLQDWAEAGLRLPSALKPLLASIEPALVLLRVGKLSPPDMQGVDQVLRAALALPAVAEGEFSAG